MPQMLMIFLLLLWFIMALLCRMWFDRWIISKLIKLKYLSILPHLPLPLPRCRADYLAFTESLATNPIDGSRPKASIIINIQYKFE